MMDPTWWSGRLFNGFLGSADLFTIYIGDRLGLNRSLAQGRPATPAELAKYTRIHERYAREWLEPQAATATSRAPPLRIH